MKRQLNNLVILCGGTGGHFFPGLSLGRVFIENGGKATLITGKHKTNYKDKYSDLYNIEIYEVQSAAPSGNPIKLTIFFLKFFIGFFQSIFIFRKLKPDAVVAMGSYTSIPSAFACRLLRIPLFLHDGNSVIGKANLFLHKLGMAKLLMSAFPAVNKNLDNTQALCVGMPLRPELTNSNVSDKFNAIAKINTIFSKNFSSEKITILIFGGSLGAKTININTPLSLKKLNIKDIQIIHLTGNKIENSTTQKLYENAIFDYLILEKFEDMALLYMASDFSICRSGGSSISELMFFNKKAILIPYPLAAENHQYYNALYFSSKEDALIIEDKDVTDNLLIEKIKEMIDMVKKLKEKNKKHTNPANKILDLIANKL